MKICFPELFPDRQGTAGNEPEEKMLHTKKNKDLISVDLSQYGSEGTSDLRIGVRIPPGAQQIQ